MESKIAKAIGLKNSPVAVLWTDEQPKEAVHFQEGKWGCVGAMLVAASKGRTAFFDRKTTGCNGGAAGLGFGNSYKNFPGGIEYFLSTGNKEFCQTEQGRKMVTAMPVLETGERYFKTPEVARKFADLLPIRDIPAQYVVFKPLEKVADEEKPKVVVFLAPPDQLSALLVLANYEGAHNQNVIAPMGAGCHSIGIIPYAEAESDNPRAVLGLFDISVRKYLDKNILSFSISYQMFEKMESNVAGSFLERDEWKEIMERN